jgi:hypothetical protein
VEATEWLIKALQRALRADATVAAWAGTDEDSLVRVYHAPSAPTMEELAGTGGSETYRYVVFHIILPPIQTYTVDEAAWFRGTVQVDCIDKTGGGAQQVSTGMAAISGVLEPPSESTLDHASLAAYENSICTPDTGMREPEFSEDGNAWRATKDYEVEFRAA